MTRAESAGYRDWHGYVNFPGLRFSCLRYTRPLTQLASKDLGHVSVLMLALNRVWTV